jgi:GT2 family glycosyltransferase
VSATGTLPISVIIPAYNRAELLPRAIAGVRAQTRPPAEIVVVDDCSDDDTAAVAGGLGCRVIRHERNLGAAAARNTGIEAARHEWLAMLDSDDERLPHHLEVLWRARAAHDIVTTSALFIDSAGNPTRVTGPPERRTRTLTAPGALLYPENIFVASGALVRRAAVRGVGGYDTTLRYSEDFDLWTRVLAHGSGHSLPEVTVLIKTHSGRKSSHHSGPGAAQRQIAERVASETGDRVRAERRIGVRAWDDLRRELHDHDTRVALAQARTMLANPQRVIGVLGIWVWRQRMSRRSRAFGAGGRARVAVLSWDPDRPLPHAGDHELMEDWRGEGAVHGLLRLLVSPPQAVVATRRAHRLLARLLDCPVRGDADLLCRH